MRIGFANFATAALLLGAITLSSGTSSAATQWWVPRGPEGGSIVAQAIDSWIAVNTGLTNLWVDAIAIDPQSPATLYAGTGGGGVFKSINGGASWSAVNTGLKNGYGMDVRVAESLAIDPQNPTTVYAGTLDGVFKSSNGGASWSAVNKGLEVFSGAYFIALAIDPKNPTTVYVGTVGGVFKSSNGGASWSAANIGLTNTVVRSLAIDPQSPTTVYAGTTAMGGGGVFKSSNGGASWSATGLTDIYVQALAIDPQSPATVYAGASGGGVFKSSNGGASWSAVNTGLPDRYVQTLAIDPQSPTTVYAGINLEQWAVVGGVFKSSNGGASWSAVNTGLTNLLVNALAIDRQSPATVYAGTYGGGVFRLVPGNIPPVKATLSQIANGGGFKTTFVLFNNTNTNATAILDLTDNGGDPLVMTIGTNTDSSFTVDLPAGASRMLQTDGRGNVATGAATVTSTSPLVVSAIFSIYDGNGNFLTETGVGSSDAQSSFVLPVDTTGFFNTGLALFNIGNGDASIAATLRDTAGNTFAQTLITLKNDNHLAVFIYGPGQLFPSISNFQGTLLLQSSIPVAAMVLRQYQHASTLSYTSLPVVPSSSTKQTLNLAQVADGGGYQTSFLIFNISASPATATLALTDDNGNPLNVTIPGRGTSSSFSFPNLALGTSLFLQTQGSGSVTATGAATITSNVPIGASGVFTVSSGGVFQTETGVGDSPVLTSLTLPVDITGNFDTGVAFFNPGSSSTTLTFRLLDSGGATVGSSATRSLSAKGHLAIFVSQLFPGTSNFRGSLAVTSTSGVAAMTLRMNSSPLSFTTLPVGSGTAK
jgi:hypothetical protein